MILEVMLCMCICTSVACVIWTPQRTTNVINGQPNAAWHVSECQKACINNSQCNGIYWNHTGFLTERAVLLCWLSGPWSGTNITITSGVEHYALNRNCLVQGNNCSLLEQYVYRVRQNKRPHHKNCNISETAQ